MLTINFLLFIDKMLFFLNNEFLMEIIDGKLLSPNLWLDAKIKNSNKIIPYIKVGKTALRYGILWNESFMKWGNRSPVESVVNIKVRIIRIRLNLVPGWEKYQMAMPQMAIIYVGDSAL